MHKAVTIAADMSARRSSRHAATPGADAPPPPRRASARTSSAASSSGSSARSARGTPRRPKAAPAAASAAPGTLVAEEENGEAEDAGEPMEPETGIFSYAKYSDGNPSMLCPVQEKVFSITPRDEANFLCLPEDARNACISAVSRLLLFKATRGEGVTRKRITDTLQEIAEDYKKHASCVLKEAQQLLMSTFGLRLLDGSQIPGANSKNDSGKYYLTNTLRTPNVMRMVWDSQDDAHLAYRGMIVAAMHAVFAAPSRKLDMTTLLKRLKEVDRHIPDSVVVAGSKKEGTGRAKRGGEESDEDEVVASRQVSRAQRAEQRENGAVKAEDSDEDYDAAQSSMTNKRKRAFFGGRINVSNYVLTSSGDVDARRSVQKMTKEGYLALSTPDGDKRDAGAAELYTFGPRFFAEIGLTRLIYSYFDARGIEPSESILKDIVKEERRLRAAIEVNNNRGEEKNGDEQKNGQR